MVKNLPAMPKDQGLIPGLGRSTGEGNGCPFQYPFLESSMAGGSRRATAHVVAKSQTRLSKKCNNSGDDDNNNNS